MQMWQQKTVIFDIHRRFVVRKNEISVHLSPEKYFLSFNDT